jgi:hypothetical protein
MVKADDFIILTVESFSQETMDLNDNFRKFC